MPREALGHFRIVGELGKGGMGEVYLAQDRKLGRRVALKILPPRLAADPQRRARFEREARLLASLNHPNIVTVYTVEEAEDVHFLTMELVEGKTLSELIPKNGLSLNRFFDLAIPLADALSAAHERGVVHRDLKPANVMVSNEGRVKVLDFGLARLAQARSDSETVTRATVDSVTEEGVLLGTAAYMSPEQAEGKAVDHRSDIFSLGVLLYEMASGRPPFSGDTNASLISAILRDTPPSLTELNHTLPRQLSRIVNHCLAKDPQRRFQTALDLGNELRELKEEFDSGEGLAPAVPAANTGASRGRRVLLAAAATVAVVAVATVAWWIGKRTEPTVGGSPIAAARFDQLTSMPGEELFPSLAPDGKSLVYAGQASGNWDIYLLRVGGQRSVNLTAGSESDDTQPAFSPDGERIAFRSEREGGGIFVMGATGESVRRVTDFGFNPTWSPDGSAIAFATEGIEIPGSRLTDSGLWVVALHTGEMRQIEVEDAVQPHWSPDGDRIAYWAVQEGSGQRDLWTISATGGTAVPATDDEFVDWNPVWSFEGGRLYFLSDRGGTMNLWSIRVDEESGKVLSEPEPITIPSRHAGHLTIARDGRRIVYAAQSARSNLQKVPFDPTTGRAGDPVPITSGDNLFVNPSVSPDGSWLAFCTEAPPVEDLFVMRIDGSERRRLTNDQYKDRSPSWSPDGDRIAFYSDRSGRYEIWTILPDGRELRQLTRTGPEGGAVAYPRWSPDGSRMSAASVEGLGLLRDLDDSGNVIAEKRFPPMPDEDMKFKPYSWSPDGARLAGHPVGPDGESAGIWSYSVATGEYHRLTDRGWYPQWLSDGQRLVFQDRGKLYILDRATEAPRELLSLEPGSVAPQFHISRDDRWIYITRRDTESDLWLLTLD